MKISKKIILALLFLFSNQVLYSQNKNIHYEDSIKKYFYSNPKKAKLITHRALENVNTDKNVEKSRKVIAYCYLAYFSNILNQKDSILYYYDKAYTEAKKSNDLDLEIIVNTNKANYYLDQNDFDAAIISYNECIELAKQTDDSKSIAYILLKKAGILYEIEKYDAALAIYLESLDNNNLQDISSQLDIKLGLARTYIKLKNPDKAFINIKPSIDEARSNNLKEHEIFFLTLLSDYYIDKKSLIKADNALNQSLLLATNSHNSNIINYVKIRLAKLFTLQNKNEEAIKLLSAILDLKKEVTSKEHLSEIYYILAENYKSINEMEKSNKFFSLFIEIYKQIGQKKIDTIDHLNKIKVSEIEKREATQVNQKKILVMVVFLLILIVVIILIIKKKEQKEEQLKFELLLDKINQFEIENPVPVINQITNSVSSIIHNNLDSSAANASYNNKNQEKVEKIEEIETMNDTNYEITDFEIENHNKEDNDSENSVTFNIKDETISEILEKLLKLEEKKAFLQQDFTLHKVAKRLKTNTAYLSKIVNTELNKSFSTYVNELRINYVILELKNNSKLRSYSIKAIGEEIGYKSTESFTKYFKIATGISPSVYIKKINKM